MRWDLHAPRRRSADMAVRDASPRAARQAAVLFVAAGVIGVLTDLLPGQPGYRNGLSLGVDCSNVVLGLLALGPLARHLSGSRSLVLAAPALVTLGLSTAAGAVPPATTGVWFVLIFLWIGSWHPRGTSLAFAPLAAATYMLPLVLRHPAPPGTLGAVLLVIPVAVLAGETMAFNASRARQSARELEMAVAALAKANLTDDLTGVGNRRLGNEMLDTLQPGDAIAILDLDWFKRVNDEFGHACGDTLLQELGAFLRRSMRTTDTVARMGGEEFMLVIRQPHNQAVLQLVERLLGRWRACSPLATLSAGLAVVGSGEAAADAYARADQALYAAKHTGRDRVVCYEDPPLVATRSAS